ncbi:MAG: ABC transporter substrate-binding protein [Devosia sp.]|nr:ABC transporter substrate-binding protein [Devosia sp.]
MRLLKAAIFAASLALVALPLAARADTPADTLVVAQNIDDIVSIDPGEAYEFSSGEYVTQTYDRLVQYDAPDVTKLVSGLADKWLVDDANKTITFTLRDGVKFAPSGNPLTAADVVYSMKRVFVINKSPAAILGAIGWTKDNVEQMVTAKDDKTLVIKYAGDISSAYVLNVLASRPASIVDSKTVAAHDVGGDMGNAWLKANSAGTGPFVLKTFRANEILSLDANPGYFLGAPAMKHVIVKHVAEAATQLLLLQSGDVDMAKDLTPDQIKGVDPKAIKVETYPQAAVHFLSFNQKDADLTNPAFWEAAHYLVDYKGMVDSFLKGQMQVHQAFWPSGFPGALDDNPYSYDPAKATKILADAGIKTPITVTLDVINASPFTDMAQSMQASFAKAGINFQIIPGTGSEVITKYRARTHQAMLLYWAPDFMDPDSNASAFAYNEDNSDGHYQPTTTWRNAWQPPADMNAETKAAKAEGNIDKRNAMYVDLQKKQQASSPIIETFQAISQVAMKPSVTGYVNGAIHDFVFYRLVKKS